MSDHEQTPGEFALRISMGAVGFLLGGWILLTTEPDYYLRLPALVVVAGSVLVILSAFIPWLRAKRR